MLFNEIKKIFNIKIIGIVILMCAIVGVLFLSSDIESFPNGNLAYQVQISGQMLEKYGTSIDENEFVDFKKETQGVVNEIDTYIRNDNQAKAAGVKSYAEFKEKSDDWENRSEAIEKLHDKYMFDMMGEKISNELWEMQEREYIINNFESKAFDRSSILPNQENKIEKRINEVIASGDGNSVISYPIIRNYNSLISNFSIIIVLSIAFMILPIFYYDKKIGVNTLQTSSKRGRKIAKTKVIAGIISTLIVVTVEFIIFFIVFSTNDTLKFWNCSVNSAIGDTLNWFSLSFGGYIILSVIAMYIIALVVASVSMFISNLASKSIELLGVAIPLIGGILWFSMFMQNLGIGMSGIPKSLLFTSYGALIIIGIVLVILIMKKSNKVEILN